MKLPAFYITLMLFISSGLVSCKKANPSDNLKESCVKGVLCYGVQGEEFVSDLPEFSQSGIALSGTQAQLKKITYSSATVIVLEITGYDQLKNTTLTMQVMYPALYDSTYLFSESNITTTITRPEKQVQDMTYWCNEYHTQNTNGYISITTIDTAAKFVSGTFNAPITCYSRQADGLWIYYENQMLAGSFDSVNLIKTGGPW